jgi:DNA (cytosine-5)-methyltransferase 1
VDLFAGIGGFHEAARSFGGQCVFASEIDEAARKAYWANYGLWPAGDITKIEATAIPDHTALFAGFPCQPFSVIGQGRGFQDARGTLFFEIARVLKEKKPRFFILENVKQLRGHNRGQTLKVILATLTDLGYKVFFSVLNALDFGLPQKRERAFIVGFRDFRGDFQFPRGGDKGDLAAILEPDDKVDPRFFATPRIVAKRRAAHVSDYFPSVWHENKSGHISSHPYSCALRAGASYNYLLVNGLRRLTPREMLRLQGFPDSFKIVCGDGQTRKQVGNAAPVNVVKAVLAKALDSLAF